MNRHQMQNDDHPYPHRGICRYCEAPVSQATPDGYWAIRTLHGLHEECEKAPRLENGCSGRHDPRRAFSPNGPVPGNHA